MDEKKQTILVAEDEESIRKFIVINLERSGYEVIEAAAGDEAIKKINLYTPDLVVLDVMLPEKDGFSICSYIREQFPHMAIIMLTARGQDMDRIMGLELGADDYMVKPFNPLELAARIRSVLRRTHQDQKTETLSCGPFRLEIIPQKVFKRETLLSLTRREYMLMKMFIENENKAISRDHILNMVWGVNFFGDMKTIDVHIRRLREKIEDHPSFPVFIETVWGVGYRFSRGE